MYGHVIRKFLKWVDLLSYGAPLLSCCFLYSKSNLYVATGLDGISSPSFKLIAPAVAPSLARVINCSIITASVQLNPNWLVSLLFTNRGVKPLLTITDLYQSTLSFRRFLINISANTSLLCSLITIYCTNANRVLELTIPAKPS